MKYRVEGQAAYVLHTRPYRDSSAIVELFTLEHGRIGAVSRGMRRPSSKSRAILQSFVPLQVAWQGRNDLKTLTLIESTGHIGLLSGKALICGLYVNELLLKLLPVFEPYPKLFVYYQYLITALVNQDIEIPLRIFERKLISVLGYAIDLSGIDVSSVYFFDPIQLVLKKIVTIEDDYKARCFLGEHLKAIANDDYPCKAVRMSAKRFNRLQIDNLLQGKELNSRQLLNVKPRS
ncbi:MAG: DNA repair protein RecO [Oceanospirillaceae bacterium]